MSKSAIARLAAWYAAQCDGSWEHAHGISVESTDNPGWWVKIDTRGTMLEGRAFTPIEDGVDRGRFPTGPSWISCRVEEGIWHGAGDAARLEEILTRFIDWTEA
jgi:hypothetical protein